MTPPAWDPQHGTLILQAVAGSRAYGLERSDSDWDWRGVFVADPKAVWSLKGPPEYFSTKEPDVHYWEIKHFLKYALSGNPTCLELLWSPSLLQHPWGQRLLAIREAFLSKNCINAYRGFATQQWRRLENVITPWGHKEYKLFMHMIRLMWSLQSILQGNGPLVKVSAEQATALKELLSGTTRKKDLLEVKQEAFRHASQLYGSSTLPQYPQPQTAEDFLLWVRVQAAQQGFGLHA